MIVKHLGNLKNFLNVLTTKLFTFSFYEKADFKPDTGYYYLTAAGVNHNPDMFISKLNSYGDFIWAKQITGTNAPSYKPRTFHYLINSLIA